ncbi:MAG: ribonuclease III [Candidatus Geothermincolales bacterium]
MGWFSRPREGAEKALGVSFRSKDLLRRALTHRSYAYERSLEPEETNERLEFLGDAVLDLIISEYLFLHRGELSEGDLTKIRSHLVNMNTLADLAREIGLGPHILLSRDERADGGEDKPSILADAMEAMIGALYLDRGLATTKKVVLRLFKGLIEDALSGSLDFDFKSRLQEMVVKEKGVLPRYRIEEEGPDHQKVFHATVYVGNQRLGRGSGRSKKEAEQEAARAALEKMSWRKDRSFGKREGGSRKGS